MNIYDLIPDTCIAGNRAMGFIAYPGIYASDFLYLRNRFLK